MQSQKQTGHMKTGPTLKLRHIFTSSMEDDENLEEENSSHPMSLTLHRKYRPPCPNFAYFVASQDITAQSVGQMHQLSAIYAGDKAAITQTHVSSTQ